MRGELAAMALRSGEGRSGETGSRGSPDQQAPDGFAGLLRRLRTEAGLTQEQLATAAGLSTRSVSDLERRVSLTARRETARLLADALALAGQVRSTFEAAAAGRLAMAAGAEPAAAAGSVAAATRTLPRDVASFTGRQAELQVLLDAGADAKRAGVADIWTIGGMAGVGKTAFAVHAAHRLAPLFPGGQLYLQLHGHSPAQGPVDPAEALASLLLTTGAGAQEIPPGLEARARLWRDHLAGTRLLLVLDDAAGHEQVRPLLPGAQGSLVLITSRGNLAALEDTRAISLDTLPPGDAAELLIRLAGREGMASGDASVEEIARLCGYLPLAIGMLARRLYHHPAWTSARLAADLAAARNRLEFMHLENLSVAAAFDLSYRDLTSGQQRLFRRLGLHPGTDIGPSAAAALDGTDLPTARRQLEELYDQHLITEPEQDRYRLHDLIREHARKLAAADPAPESEAAVARLLGYYTHGAVAASQYLTRKSPRDLHGASPPSLAGGPDLTSLADGPDLASRAEAAEWMEAERLGLHAAAASRAGTGHAIVIAAAMHGFLRGYGYWDQALALHQIARAAARELGDQLAEAGTLADLGEIQQVTGEYREAAVSLTSALQIYRDLGDEPGQASALNELGVVRFDLNDRVAAVASHREALRLYRKLGDRSGEASALNELGLVQRATGEYEDAGAGHGEALRLYRAVGNRIGEASSLNRLGQVQRSTGDFVAASESHEQARRLHRELGNRVGEATALFGLGIVQQATADPEIAVASQSEALRLARDLGYPLGEATALAGLGAAQLAGGNPAAAIASYSRALTLHRDLGNHGGQVTAFNGLGAAYLAIGDRQAATASLTEALALCGQIGYRSGEAESRKVLGAVQLAAGDFTEAAASLRLALDQYTELGIRHGQAEVLNSTGELLLAATDYRQARHCFTQALAIAAGLALRVELARANAGLNRCAGRASLM
jgi:tetratricopeptide (TPR) repeat protein/transcriptional regulator with XRE-family HTH domain